MCFADSNNFSGTERNYYATKSISGESDIFNRNNLRSMCRTPNDLKCIFKPYTLRISEMKEKATDESSVTPFQESNQKDLK